MNRPPTWPPQPFREKDPLPPQGDYTFWRRQSLPVLEILQQPRDWSALDAWTKDARFGKSRLRQVLAWLEQRGEASTFVQVTRGGGETLYWASAAWLNRYTLPPHART